MRNTNLIIDVDIFQITSDSGLPSIYTINLSHETNAMTFDSRTKRKSDNVISYKYSNLDFNSVSNPNNNPTMTNLDNNFENEFGSAEDMSQLQIRDTELMMKMLSKMPDQFKKKFLTLLLLSDRGGLYELVREMISFHMTPEDSLDSVVDRTNILPRIEQATLHGKSLSSSSIISQILRNREFPITKTSSQFNSRQGLAITNSSVPAIQSAVILHRETISEPGRVVSFIENNRDKNVDNKVVSSSAKSNDVQEHHDGADVELIRNSNKNNIASNAESNQANFSQISRADFSTRMQNSPAFGDMMKNLLEMMKTKKKLTELISFKNDFQKSNSSNKQEILNNISSFGKELLQLNGQNVNVPTLASDLTSGQPATLLFGQPEVTLDNFSGDTSKPIGIQLLSDQDISNDNLQNSDKSIFQENNDFIPSPNNRLPNNFLTALGNVIGQTLIPLSTDIEGQFFDEDLDSFIPQTPGTAVIKLANPNGIISSGDNDLVRFVPLSTDFEGQFIDNPQFELRKSQVTGINSQNVGVPLPQSLPNTDFAVNSGIIQDAGEFPQTSVGVALPHNSANTDFTANTGISQDAGGFSQTSVGVALPNFSNSGQSSTNVHTGPNTQSTFTGVGVPLPSANFIGSNNAPQLQNLVQFSNSLATEFGVARDIDSRTSGSSIGSIPLLTNEATLQTVNNADSLPSKLLTNQGIGVPLPIINNNRSPASPINEQLQGNPAQMAQFGVSLPTFTSDQISFLRNQLGIRLTKDENELKNPQPASALPVLQEGQVIVVNKNSNFKDLSSSRETGDIVNIPSLSFKSFEIPDASFNANAQLSVDNRGKNSYKNGDEHKFVTFLTPGIMVPYSNQPSGLIALNPNKGNGKGVLLDQYPSKSYTGECNDQ